MTWGMPRGKRSSLISGRFPRIVSRTARSRSISPRDFGDVIQRDRGGEGGSDGEVDLV